MSGLYDKYLEYGELLAGQGMLTTGGKYASLVPEGYGGEERERLLRAGGKKAQRKTLPQATSSGTQYGGYGAQASGAVGGGYGGYGAPVNGNYAPSGGNVYNPPLANVGGGPYASTSVPTANHSSVQSSYNPYAPNNPYASAPSQPYEVPAYGIAPTQPAPAPSSFLPAPPPAIGTTPITTEFSQTDRSSVPPPPQGKAPSVMGNDKTVGGWNDAPALKMKSAVPAPAKKQGIASPFPNSPVGTPAPPQGFAPQQGFGVPPPPRGSTPKSVPPPPRG